MLEELAVWSADADVLADTLCAALLDVLDSADVLEAAGVLADSEVEAVLWAAALPAALSVDALGAAVLSVATVCACS